jgi:hypothetical protein
MPTASASRSASNPGPDRQTDGSAKSRCVGRQKEPHRGARTQTQCCCNIYRNRGRPDQQRTGYVALPFRPAEQGRKHRTHRVDDRLFVHAVEFLTVDLVGVEHRRMHQRQALATPENRAFAGTANPGKHVEDLGAPRRRQAGYSDSERIGDKRHCR